MAWKIELSQEADRLLDKLDPQIARRILKFLQSESPNSTTRGASERRCMAPNSVNSGSIRRRLSLICSIEDKLVLILVLRIGHRREVYER